MTLSCLVSQFCTELGPAQPQLVLSIVTRLEENVETLEVENMTMLNCMTRIDGTKSTGKLFVGAAQSENELCGDDAIGGTVQQREDDKESGECRDDAVGERVQQVDEKKLFARTVRPELCADDAIGGMVQWGEDGK